MNMDCFIIQPIRLCNVERTLQISGPRSCLINILRVELRFKLLDDFWMTCRNTGPTYDRVIGNKFRCVH